MFSKMCNWFLENIHTSLDFQFLVLLSFLNVWKNKFPIFLSLLWRLDVCLLHSFSVWSDILDSVVSLTQWNLIAWRVVFVFPAQNSPLKKILWGCKGNVYKREYCKRMKAFSNMSSEIEVCPVLPVPIWFSDLIHLHRLVSYLTDILVAELSSS